MSLDTSLNIAFTSLRVTEAQMATSSANVTNASKTGYTTKVYDVSYTSSGSVTVPTGGLTIGSIDYTLSKEMINDINQSTYYSTLAASLDNISTALGNTDGTDSLSNALSTLETSLQTLESSPSDQSQKLNVVAAATTIADNLHDLTDTIQNERLVASQSIETSVTTVNTLLDQLDDLNEQIQQLSNLGKSTADLEDERMVALESLSGQIGINYFFDSSNNVQIYTTSGTILLNSTAHHLSYQPTSYVTDETVYPGGFSGIMVDGKDITTSISGGTIGANIELRDEKLVDLQNAVNTMASSIIDTVNAALSSGTTYPAQTALTGMTSVQSSDALSSTGSVRIALVDSSGTVMQYSDLDLSSVSTVADLVNAIDSLANISTSLNSDGQLVITSDNADYGIAMNQMDSALGSDSQSLAQYFGIGTLFTGTDASDIQVNQNLLDDNNTLPMGLLSSSSSLAVGDLGVTSGDVSAITATVNALKSSISFTASGTMPAQTTTIQNYITRFISAVAVSSDTLQTQADSAQDLYDSTKSTLENSTGVNIDEETMKITEFQNQYEAAATLVSTIRELFSTLLEAVN